MDEHWQKYVDESLPVISQLYQLKINEKNQVIYKFQDEIFDLKEPLPEDELEPLEDYSQCNLCSETSKLKNCQFCGQLTCSKHLDHQRPFCQDREKKSHQVCLTCDRRILYREAMLEMKERLEMFDRAVTQGQAWLKEEETQYDKIVTKSQK